MKQKKTITAVVVGTGKPTTEDIGLVKGTTLEDLRRVMKNVDKKKSYVFIRKKTGEQLAEGVDLFEMLDDHEKVEISATAFLGGMRDSISRLFSFLDENGPPVAYPGMPWEHEPVFEPPVAMPIEALSLEGQLIELGWEKRGLNYCGYIYGPGEIYSAELRHTWSGYQLFIHNPPASIFSGIHKDCFVSHGNGWYFVHFRKKEGTTLSMVRATEAYFIESGRCAYV